MASCPVDGRLLRVQSRRLFSRQEAIIVVGKTLGHYEILEPLGKGGMGEVYRARDTKLDRDVAIKVLPEELSADPDRLARLEREAHLLAAGSATADLPRRAELVRGVRAACADRVVASAVRDSSRRGSP